MASFVKKVKLSTLAVMYLLVLSKSHAYAAESYQHLTLNDAVRIALENNLQQRISLQAAEIAESLHQEAHSADWSTINFQATAMRMDEVPTFTFPVTSVSIAALAVPKMSYCLVGHT